jgi:hypothetical protein
MYSCHPNKQNKYSVKCLTGMVATAYNLKNNDLMTLKLKYKHNNKNVKS